MGFVDRIVKVVDRHIVGPKSVIELESNQESVVQKSKNWCVLELSAAQANQIQTDTGFLIKEIFVILPERDRKKESDTFDAVHKNLGILTKSSQIEVAHKTLDPKADFEDLKALSKAPPGTSIQKSYFVAEESSYEALKKGLGLEEVRNKVAEFDVKSVGTESWILGKHSRDFEYLKFTSPETRADFAKDYNYILFQIEFNLIYSKKLGSFSKIMLEDNFFEIVQFIPYKQRVDYAKDWWRGKVIETDIQSDISEDKWIKQCLLDAQELYYRSVRASSGNKSEEMEDFYLRRNEFHQTIVSQEIDSDDLNLRKQFNVL